MCVCVREREFKMLNYQDFQLKPLLQSPSGSAQARLGFSHPLECNEHHDHFLILTREGCFDSQKAGKKKKFFSSKCCTAKFIR